MWCNTEKVGIIATMLVLFGLAVGFLLGIAVWEFAWRTESVREGFAEYSSETGAWRWRSDLRRPLHDQRGWEECPVCGGRGEIFLDFEVETSSAGSSVDRNDPITWYDPSKPVEEM